MELQKPQTLKVTAPVEIFSEKGYSKDVALVKNSFDWTFSNCDLEVRSPSFTFGIGNNCEATLVTKKTNAGVGSYRSIFLQFTKIGPDCIAKVTFLLISVPNDSTNVSYVGEHSSMGWGFTDVYDNFFKEYTSVQEVSTVRCEILLLSGTTITKAANLEVPQSHLLESFATLYTSKMFTDVTFVIGEEKLQAHKNILAARCDVFRAMFQNDMKESKSNIVKITDASVEGFKDLLLFIYTGKVACLDTLGEELLCMAEKYALQDLKVICEESLVKSLSVDNVARAIILADRYRATRLKAEAVCFVHKRRQEVRETDGWKRAKKEHANVIAEAFLEY